VTEQEQLVPEDDAIIGRAFRWSLAIFAVVGAALASLVLVLRRAPELPPAKEAVYVPPRVAEREAVPPPVWFTDVTHQAGIAFERFNGATGEKLLPETMGGGAAFLDADADGDADLLLVNGTSWARSGAGDGGLAPSQAFYRNESTVDDVRFVDATAEAGFDFSMQGMGVAVGDTDGDGDPDVFLTGVGGNRFLVNAGGRFSDDTARAGLAGDGAAWSTAATFLDAENDGDLDLYVGNYVVWSRELDLAVDYRLLGTERAYGPPMNFASTQPWFYAARGDGSFEEVGAELGLHVVNPATGAAVGKAMAAMAVDVDADGWCDLVVANDTVANFLYHNVAGLFEERATAAGFAYDSSGRATGAMGVDAADYRNDGSLGVAIGNFANEMTSLYASEDGGRLFTDAAIVEGIGPASRQALSFGVLFVDYDLDGRPDLLQTNGHLEDQIHKVQASMSYRQPAQLFWNAGSARRAVFTPVDGATLGDFARPLVGRGATAADVDGDGDVDLLFTQSQGPPMLLRNDQQLENGWIKLRLVGAAANRDAVGAWVEVEANGAVQRRPVTTTRSYLTAVEPTLAFGLGAATRADRVRVRWPGGGVQELADVAGGQTLVIEQCP
jgi:hypothetical protein